MLWIRDELSNNALIRLCVNKIPSTLRKHLAQRKEIGSKAVMKQVSKAIITQHNEYLLQLRDDHPGIFSTPINGHFSAGIWNSARPPGRLSSVNFSKNWNDAPREADFFISGAIRIILSVSISSSFRSKVIETSWFFTKGRTAMVQY